VWVSNARNNFAPYAGYMLMGYEKTRRVESAREESDAVDDAPADDEATGNKTDDVPLGARDVRHPYTATFDPNRAVGAWLLIAGAFVQAAIVVAIVT
jgi:hypothetical protein